MFAILEHTADVGFAFAGASTEDAYREAARALTWLLVGDATVEPRVERAVALAGEAPEDRLYGFLSELVYLFDAEHVLVADVRFGPGGVTVAGEPYSRDRHGEIQTYVKAITYHQLAFECRDGRCEGRVYVDI